MAGRIFVSDKSNIPAQNDKPAPKPVKEQRPFLCLLKYSLKAKGILAAPVFPVFRATKGTCSKVNPKRKAKDFTKSRFA